MSKHHCKKEYNYPMMMGGYGMGGYGGYGGDCGYGVGLKWFYALLILIVIVLQFSRRNCNNVVRNTELCDGEGTVETCAVKGDHELIDRSILFIIVIFLLIICAGCWGGKNCGYGYGGGYGF